MRIVFFGSGAFGLPTLRSLAGTHEIVAVVTQPDRPAGRGGRLTATPIGEFAAIGLPAARLVKPERVGSPEIVAQIRAMAMADDAAAAAVFVVIAFGQKLPRSLLSGVLAINLHASALPRWRGAAPINAAIIGGDSHTGNSVITLADRMDEGDILARSRTPIGHEETAGELHDRLAADGPRLVGAVLELAAQRTSPFPLPPAAADAAPRSIPGEPEAALFATPLLQDHALATLAPKLGRADSAFDPGLPPSRLRCLINGLTPWPGVAARLGTLEIKLRRARETTTREVGSDVACGTIIDPLGGTIACGPPGAARSQVLQILEVQPAGGRTMDWASFARGRSIVSGQRLEPSAARSSIQL